MLLARRAMHTQGRAHHLMQFGAVPALLRQYRLDVAQRDQSAFERALLLGDAVVGSVAEYDAEPVADGKQPVGHPAALVDDGLGLGADGLPARHHLVEELRQPGVARAGEYFPQNAADHILRLAAEVPRRFAVEQQDAPVAVDRVEALADAVENRYEPGLAP